MISILVSSKSPDIFCSLQKNIYESIGDVGFELLHYENYEGRVGLCKIYNDLAKSARYENLIFLHEDVLFHTIGWGKKIDEVLRNKNIGLVGLLGSTVITKVPSSWAKQDKNFNYGKIIQTGDLEKTFNATEDLTNVIAIDGVFMATRKSVWDEIKFNEILVKGFHGYDFQFSMEVYEKYEVVVTNDIILEHFSKGNFTIDWVDTTFKLNKYWSKRLAVSVQPVDANTLSNLEYWQAVFIFNVLKKLKLQRSYYLYTIKQFLAGHPSRLLLLFRLLKQVR